MKKVLIFLTFLAFIGGGTLNLAEAKKQSLTNLFYYYPSTEGYQSVKEHYRDIDILSPQLYSVDQNLEFIQTGSDDILKLAKKKHIKVMPLLTNLNFSKELATRFLADEDAQEEIIDELVRLAKKKKFIGWQLDFENISHLDRDAYVSFVKKVREAFDAKNLQLSVAIVPRSSDYDSTSTTQDWSSAYNTKELAKYVDFISIMSYDDPRSVGPVASLPYVNSVLSYTLTQVDASKVSLGIPLYCWQWNQDTNQKIANLSYERASNTKETYKNNQYQSTYFDYYGAQMISFTKDNGEHHVIWCDNAKSIEAKLKLAKDKGLYGTSSWSLGQEDENAWDQF